MALAVPTTLKACPYHDTRFGRPMNQTALKQVNRHWDHVLAALSALSGPTAGDAFVACCRLRWGVLAHEGPLPEPMAACFKTALGLGRPLSSWLLLSPGSAAQPLDALLRADVLVERLDEEGWLHGKDQVCGAPPAHLEDAWRALAAPAPVRPPPLTEAQLAVADAATEVVVGSWAVLGATRAVLRDGTHTVHNWAPAGPVDPDWPEVLRLLRSDGPGALVREVPRFEPEWALHVYAEPPASVLAAVAGARRALGASDPLAALDGVWAALVDGR